MSDSIDAESHWRVRALIRHSALINNISAIRKIAGETKIYAVVKADAYGHGAAELAKCADMVDGYAVATIEEGISLREMIASQTAAVVPVMVLSEFNHPEQISLFRQHQLQLVIHKPIQLSWLKLDDAEHNDHKLDAWIKFDTGMGRLGLPVEAAAKLVDRFQQLTNLNHCGLMSHLASADQLQCNQTQEQFLAFKELGRFNLPVMSLSNSAGLLTIGVESQNMVRPGILLYGISPLSSSSDPDTKFDPVMIFQSRLIDIKPIAIGQTVGYGSSWRAERDGRIGIVACGYADGYPRLASNRGEVMINDKPAAIIGKVSMDTLAVDLSDHDQAESGDIVELWGTQISVSRVAEWAETIPYELLCQVGKRVPRVAID